MSWESTIEVRADAEIDGKFGLILSVCLKVRWRFNASESCKALSIPRLLVVRIFWLDAQLWSDVDFRQWHRRLNERLVWDWWL